MKSYDVIIIGAGAAGLMCAGIASKRDKKVLLIESSKNIGEKIRISGGGRCNFTNLNISVDNFLSKNPSFCISALKRYTQFDFIELVKKHKISYHEKTASCVSIAQEEGIPAIRGANRLALSYPNGIRSKKTGQLFCDKSSKQIIDMLVDEFKTGQVELKTSTKVEKIEKNDEKFIIKTQNEVFEGNSLIIATGGLSIPKMGATDFGYKIARQFGLKIIQTKPALVPVVLEENILTKTKNLAGVSTNSITSIGKRKFEEGLLFTHKGLSGPAILQISSYLDDKNAINVNLAAKIDILKYLKDHKETTPKSEILSILTQILPKSLVLHILNELEISFSQKLAEINNKKLVIIAKNINNWQIKPKTTEGYAKAEVTLGGVDTDEISSKSFESKKIKNLYFIGEVLDVTGHLGGYNFQWSWSSGFAAGMSV